MKDLFKNSSQKNVVAACKKKDISNAWPATKFFQVNFFLFGDLQCLELLILLIFSPINGLVFVLHHCFGS